ncbi:MAG: hypothetical protein LBM00_06720 [Deltaproteobacteria bacterium]|jgi:hypothetical protein|nr:hypothetical protein [Deltaproteobacteria bacterium]
MTQAYDIPMLLFGQCLYAVAALVRFVRLYTSMGKARPPFVTGLAVTHCLGVALGYFFGVLWYELTVLFFFALQKRDTLVAAFAALLLLRGLDAALLLLLSLYAVSYEEMRPMLFCLSALLLGIGFFLFSFTAALRRAEKKILEFPQSFSGDIVILKGLHIARKQIALLSWQRRGNLSLLVLLTLSGWFAEWLAFFCLRPTAEQALADMLGRVLGSFHFIIIRSGTDKTLEALQPGIWGLSALMAAIHFARLIRIRLSQRGSA